MVPARLKNCAVYLAGGISYVKDFRGWRDEFRQEVAKSNIELLVEDPIQKPDGLICEEEELQKTIKLMIKNNYWDELSLLMKKIVRIDLRMVDKADIVVAHICKEVPTFGTVHEIALASQQHKPVLVICPNGKASVPNWFFGFLKHQEFFDTVPQCVEYLNKINKAEIEPDSRWVLIDLLAQKVNKHVSVK